MTKEQWDKAIILKDCFLKELNHRKDVQNDK